MRMEGLVQDRSQLLPGESAQVSLVLDRAARVLSTTFAGQKISLAVT